MIAFAAHAAVMQQSTTVHPTRKPLTEAQDRHYAAIRRNVACPCCGCSRDVQYRPWQHNFRCKRCKVVFTKARSEGKV